MPNRSVRAPSHASGTITRRVSAPVDPTAISEAMYKQDVAPFQEGFEVLAQEMAHALPRWTDKIGHDKPAERAGLLLRTMRNAAGMSQTKLAEIAGMNQSDISALETGGGKQGPTFDVLARIADACGFYVTFAAKPEAGKRSDRPGVSHAAMAPMEIIHQREPASGEPKRIVRTYVMSDDGELSEFEGESPALKKEDTIILDDSAGHTYKVSVEAPRATVVIEEAEADVAAAVQQVQSAGE